jgi:Protein of unknown function (DUF1161)
MFKLLVLTITLALACSASYASNCEALREQVESKIKAAGVASFTVTVVDSAANAAGKVVGSCDKGAKKIMYLQTKAAGGAPAKPTGNTMLTECKDGSAPVGGNCKK